MSVTFKSRQAFLQVSHDNLFIANEAGYVLRPAQYLHCSTAEGKTFRFNMGAERNKYITADKEEISILRNYVLTNANCGISDPTYKPPVFEE